MLLVLLLQVVGVWGASQYDFQWISSGADYTLAIKTDGTALSWGFPFSEREKIYIPLGYLWSYLKAGISHSCGVTDAGVSMCWGRSREGQGEVPAGYGFTQFTMGEAHTCGLTNTSELLCWGSPIDETLNVPVGHNWSQVDAGTVHTCAVNATGSLFCWGKQGYDRKAVPYSNRSDITWQEVACGDRHCCGILEVSAVQTLSRREEDNVICWGDDANQQLQVQGKEQGRTGPQETFTNISAGNYHTCGLTRGMDVWCWGRVSQYGLNFQTPGNATLLSTGGIHACILDTAGQAHCWGGDTVGQAQVPVDGATAPPSIMQYANDPFDISNEDPTMRIKQYIPGYTEPVRVNQHIIMDILFTEYAQVNTPMLSFERIDGALDPYSPHVLTFPVSWNPPIINSLKISAFNLSLWYDETLGPSPAVRTISSTVVAGVTEHRLVDGGAYSVRLSYQDTFGHPAATHWIQRYEVTYDLSTSAPSIWSPSPGSVKQAIFMHFYLPEDMNPDDVWIVLTFTGPSPGESVTDSGSPYEVQLAQALTTQGNHSFQLVLGDLYNTLDGRRSAYVRQVTAAGATAALGVGIVSGGTYDVVLRVADTFFNARQTAQVSGLSFVWDTATEALTLQALSALNDPVVLQYSIPETVMAGSLSFELLWLSGVEDVQSPHRWVVNPSKEQAVTNGTLSHNLRLSASNLFRDPDNEALPHPDIRRFESTGTPVYSTLQPSSQYQLSISYQDIFGNPVSLLTLTLPTNFTKPSAPSRPTLNARTSTSLELAWVRGATGGLRITKYDVQLQVAADPPSWWNGTDAEAAAYASTMGGALQEQVVVGQESNRATFRDLVSSGHYLVRVRAWNIVGESEWSDWAIFRVLSACADGAPHDAEECDDGNMLDGDGCSSSCLVERAYTCEAEPAGLYADGWGRGSSRCRASGMDGLRVPGEECDDCNFQAGDGCDNGKVEPGYVCVYQGRLGIETGCPGILAADTNNYLTFTADECRVKCGDGVRHIVAGEECDDGNVLDGDGCSSDCRIEEGYSCAPVGWPEVLRTACQPICGDGLRLGDEECDGNATGVTGCGADCKVETGWFCDRTENGEVCMNTCNNGVIDAGEECDDANDADDDGCTHCKIDPGWRCEAIARRTATSPSSFCVPICGDGLRIERGHMTEACDDGNHLAGDGCDPSCQIEPGFRCISQAAEVNTTALRCEPICGDGLLVNGEACDDGNQVSGDGCGASCQVENGFVCMAEDVLTRSEVVDHPFAAQNRTSCVPICGDGVVLLRFGEACDDGGRVPGDGCDELCQVEEGYACGSSSATSPSVCSPICGDGLMRSPEQCDDGNRGKGDGCDEQCQLEQGYICWPPGVACRFLCGDGLRLEGEDCDDGNLVLEDGCDTQCRVEDGWTCRSYVYAPTNATSVCSPVCGDGKLRGAEACDDGNLVSGDGCDANCTVEASWVCCQPANITGSLCVPGVDVSICASPCGNGHRDEGEACDDGNVEAEDGCSPRCEVEQGFACTPMSQIRPGRKTPDHCEAICGDGLLVRGEECDDGNKVSGDGCSAECKIEQRGTQCFPVSDLLGGVCRPSCGDGVRGPREECDDGNSVPGDGCSANCEVERGFTCSGGGMQSLDTCWPICGDGVRVDASFSNALGGRFEACDTGPVPSRGCDASTCQVREGWTCARPAGGAFAEVCTPICGDGLLMTPIEECDDNNNLPGDGCSPDCKVEELYQCSYSSFLLRSLCQIRCGDGRQHETEACDDGNTWDQDGCSSRCQVEPGFACRNGTLALPSVCQGICGDGVEVHGESCDDGNLVAGDGCDPFCQVEAGYHCSRAPAPGEGGSPSVCTPSCGDGVMNFAEECDVGSTRWCYQCRRLPERACGDFRRTFGEGCDDGNNVSGDGCSEGCDVEPGWSCDLGPSHLAPYAAPGDSCWRICGDGLVLAGEACDDGNLRGDDGCSGDCQVEPFFQCFLPGASELLQVPSSEQQSNGPNASICVRTTPPRLIGAHFDASFVTVELAFDSAVAPLPGEDGGASSFACSTLLDDVTVALLGTSPRCWWKSRQRGAISLGSEPGLVPGSSVVLRGNVVRRYVFSSDAAPSQDRKADVMGGLMAPVPWPRPVISGPQLVPSCADSTTLGSANSQGLAGRMALPRRWSIVAAFNVSNGSWDAEELLRAQNGLVANSQDAEVTFPRQGAILGLLDLEFDRSLRVNFLYRICLQQQNIFGLVGTSCHHLEVDELPLPSVEPLVPPGPYTIPRYGRWLNVEMRATIPEGCVVGDAPLPTTFLAGQVALPSHGLTLQEPLDLLASWSYETSWRTIWGQEAPSLTEVSAASALGQERNGSRMVVNPLAAPPGLLQGFAQLYAVACVNATRETNGSVDLEEVCGYYTFPVISEELPVPMLTPRSWVSVLGLEAQLQLVGVAPDSGMAPLGPPLQAPGAALERMDVWEDLAGNLQRAERLQLGSLGEVMQGSATVYGAILLSNSSAVASLMPVVTWSVEALTRTGQAITQPSSVGGFFLKLLPDQLSFGSQVRITAQVDLFPADAGATASCSDTLASLRQEAVVSVGLPPAAGYILLDRTQVITSTLDSFVLESIRWTSDVLPLQYRIEAELASGRRMLLSDWSYNPKLPVVFLPRSETLLMRGQVRDGRGSFAETGPESVALIATGGPLLPVFQVGQMLAATYAPRIVLERLSSLRSTALTLDVALQVQLWQDVAYSWLSTAFNGTLRNCSEDCVRGRCAEDSQSCVCDAGWQGMLCEIQSFEVESQQIIVQRVLANLQELWANPTNLEVLGFTTAAGALGRALELLRHLGGDCRRVSQDAVAYLGYMARGLAEKVPLSAIRADAPAVTGLIQQIYSCMQSPEGPSVSMAAPATVLLTALGSSQICQALGSTSWCYDLVSSKVRLSCPQGNAMVSCEADLTLRLVEPYPCPCAVENPFLGYGRSSEESWGLTREEQDLVWRELLQLFWNRTAYNDTTLDAALAKSLRSKEPLRNMESSALHSLHKLSELLADAMLASAVPGQAPSTLSSLPLLAHWDAATLVPDEISSPRNGSAVLVLGTGTTLEVAYEPQALLPSMPLKVPMAALHWSEGRILQQLDPSVKLHTEVVQLRLLDTAPYNRSKLRYRFQVPDTPLCSARRPAQEWLELCCNATNDTGSPGTFAPAPCSFAAAETVMSTTSTTTSSSVSSSTAEQASLVEMLASHMPFHQGLESLLEDVNFWVPKNQMVLMAGTRLQLSGGELQVSRACDRQGDASGRLSVDGVVQGPQGGFAAESFCTTVFTRAEAKRASAQRWETFADLLLQAAEEVLADPSVLPTSTTSSISTSTSTGSTMTLRSITTTSASRTSTSSSVTLTGNETSTETLTATSTSTSRSLTTTSSTSTSQTQTSSSTSTVPWCSMASAASRDAWCFSGLDAALPQLGQASLADEGGVLLLGVWGAQLSLNGSAPMAMSFGGSARLVLHAPERSLFFLWAMVEIFSFWASSYRVLHVADVRRSWWSSTTTSTSYTRTTTTSKIERFQLPLPASGLLLDALEARYDELLRNGSRWEAAVPSSTTSSSTMTFTVTSRTSTTTTTYLLDQLCPSVPCVPQAECGIDPADLECVAWSEALQRFLPALGCSLVTEPGRQWPQRVGAFELLCECEGWALHPAMAIADKRPELTPLPPQVIITEREFTVFWLDKANRYNLRGLALVFFSLLLLLLHTLVGSCAEVRWRMQARWVTSHSARSRNVLVEVKTLYETEEAFIRRRRAEIRREGEFSAAVVAAEAETVLRQAEGLQRGRPTTTTALDLRQAKDGLATLFQAQGLGDVEDDLVRPALSQGPPSPTVSTAIVTHTLTKQTPALSSVPPPGPRSPPTLSLRAAAHEEAFQPEAIILKKSFRERLMSAMSQFTAEGLARCTRHNLWRSCLVHHKILSLNDDSQTWTFSAPERASVFHMSLWLNAACLALTLGGGIPRRPWQDPNCHATGCTLQGSEIWLAAVAGCWSAAWAFLVQIFCRGRAFLVRAKELDAKAREGAFRRHFLGPWPYMIMAPEEAQVRLTNLWAPCCCCCLKRRPLVPLHWQPSLVPCCLVLLIAIMAWTVCFYSFFFSSSIYMYEVSRTDTPVLEIVYPPNERAEVQAAESELPLDSGFILVPEMWRYLILLVISCLFNYVIFEPLLLLLHLFLGEPSLQDVLDMLQRAVQPLVERLQSLASWCVPQHRRDQAYELWNQMLQPVRTRGLALSEAVARRLSKRSKVAPAPADLQETIESESEDEVQVKVDKEKKRERKEKKAHKHKAEGESEHQKDKKAKKEKKRSKS